MYIPVSGVSNLALYTPLAQQLVDRGHQVTIVTSIATPELPGQKNILVSSSVFTSFRDDLSVFLISESKASIWESLKRATHFYRSMLEVHSEALRHPDIQSILYCSDHRKCGFDLVITSPLFNEMGVLLGDLLSAPTILFVPVNDDNFLAMSQGFPNVISWSGPGQDTTAGTVKTYLINILYQNIIKPYMFVQQQYEQLRNHVQNYALTDYAALERNADAGFYFSSPVLGQLSARLPNAINVGFIHCRKGSKLPADLEDWINAANTTIIYISMGSIFQLPDDLILMFEQVLEKLPVRVIWKRNQKYVNEKYYQRTWLPQQDILSSGKVSLFINQIGMVSLQESVYHAVPVLGLPVSYEQKLNANVVKKKMIGRTLEYKHLSPEYLSEEISQLLCTTEYSDNIKKLSSLVKDRQTTPLEEAVWWAEYTIKHKGCDHLKSSQRHSANLVTNNFLSLVFEVLVLVLVILLTVLLFYKGD